MEKTNLDEYPGEVAKAQGHLKEGPEPSQAINIRNEIRVPYEVWHRLDVTIGTPIFPEVVCAVAACLKVPPLYCYEHGAAAFVPKVTRDSAVKFGPMRPK